MVDEIGGPPNAIIALMFIIVIMLVGAALSYANEHWLIFGVSCMGLGWFLAPLVMSLDNQEKRS